MVKRTIIHAMADILSDLTHLQAVDKSIEIREAYGKLSKHRKKEFNTMMHMIFGYNIEQLETKARNEIHEN